MPTYSDAIGYLNDLATELNEPWFKMLCDNATVSGMSALDQLSLDTLYALYIGSASYVSLKLNSSIAATPAAVAQTDFLEQLSGFANFKLLGSALDVSFKKRITLIFGANGSGKSSLCEALKVLSNPEQPGRPLENVRTIGATSPTFQFKFKSDAAPQTWTSATGYGSKRSTVKYFDTAIAIQNVTNAVEPGRIIVLAPFKIHIFAWVKTLTTNFREALQREQRGNSSNLTQALQTIRSDFLKFKGRPLATVEERSDSVLASEIKLGEEFKNQHLLNEKRATVAELDRALSDEGLKLLQAEHRELEALLAALNELLISATSLWSIEPSKKTKALVAKQIAQEVLAKELIPTGSTLDNFLGLLNAASLICKMDQLEGHACPLCKRDLSTSDVELFKQYHALLVGELENEINAIKTEIHNASKFLADVSNLDRNAWDKYKTIPDEILSAAKSRAEVIISSCDMSKEPTEESLAALQSLNISVTTWSISLASKNTAIEIAANGRDALLTQLAKLRIEIEPLEYAQAIANQLEALYTAKRMADQARFWNTKLPEFTQVLRRITDKSKLAHEDLIVSDFESRLDAEYRVLAEKNMAAFGVRLARKGADAAVTVLPQVGGKRIDGVLSEGEQRLHALALFFSELETCAQSVLVFDDPISSFDYNNIANYCARLRNFVMKFADRQVIVLTHNWEFFVQLQTAINVAGHSHNLSVQVLESCSVVADYTEKLDELKTDINTILALPVEPTKPQKEEMAGKMRRLIEAVVNTHVFNNQRQQYKQRKQSVSEFHNYTRLIRLEPAEATILRDLYGKLSISEHDDVRNAYINTDKATFQSRYDAIIAVETAIVSRK